MKEFKYIELDNGLGDNIICASLLMWLSKRYRIFIKIPPVQEKNRVTYESFYRGTGITVLQEDMGNLVFMDPAIISQVDIKTERKIIFDPGDPEWPRFEKLHSAIGHKQGFEDIDTSYPNGFFLNYNTTYSIRKKYCPLRKQSLKVKQLPVPKEPYAFIHEDYARGFLIDGSHTPIGPNLYINAEFNPGQSILAYRDLIENATEIHCIDSSIFNLVNSFQPQGKLYYHWYARPHSPQFAMHPEWNKLI